MITLLVLAILFFGIKLYPILFLGAVLSSLKPNDDEKDNKESNKQ